MHNKVKILIMYTVYLCIYFISAPDLSAGFVQTQYSVLETDVLEGVTVCAFINGNINQNIVLSLSVSGGNATG